MEDVRKYYVLKIEKSADGQTFCPGFGTEFKDLDEALDRVVTLPKEFPCSIWIVEERLAAHFYANNWE